MGAKPKIPWMMRIEAQYNQPLFAFVYSLSKNPRHEDDKLT
jgi:hypothetical protein